MPTQTPTRFREKVTPWRRTEVEQLVGWMEENQERLRGKQMDWYKEVKEQVFKDDNHITVKRIKEKAMNMKNSWKQAKVIQERSGWGLKPGDCSQSIHDVLEKKCMLFWRLDEIWGSRPNSTPIHLIDSSLQITHTESQDLSGRDCEDREDYEMLEDPRDHEGTEYHGEQIGTVDASKELEDLLQIEAEDGNAGGDVNVDDSDSNETETPRDTQLRSESESTGRQRVARSQRDSSTMSSVYSLPRRETRDRMTPIKRILDDRHEQMADMENKRMCLKKDMQKEKIEAEDRRHQRQMELEERRLERQTESNERIAKMQAEITAEVARIQSDAQVRQLQAIANMISSVVGSVQKRPESVLENTDI